MSRSLVALAMVLGSAAAAKERVLVLGVTAADAKMKPLATQVSEQLLTELSTSELHVMGQTDLVAMLGLERQKQLLGCADASSQCLAELSGAMGARYLVQGALGSSGDMLRLDLKLLDTRDGSAVARVGEAFVASEVFSVVARLSSQLVAALPKEAGTPVNPVRVVALVGAGLGVVAASVGAGLLVAANGAREALVREKETLFYSDAEARLNAARGTQLNGAILLGVGAAVLAAGVTVFAVSGESKPVSAGVSVGAGGGAVWLGGRW